MLKPNRTERHVMFMYMLAMPTPAIMSSAPRWPTKALLIVSINKAEQKDTIEGTPIFRISFNAS
jgi:hypothetical protein